jgi:hypothetical protein
MLLVGPNGSQDLLATIENANIVAVKIIMVGLDVLSIYDSELLTTWKMCLYESINIVSVSSNIQTMIDAGNMSALGNLNVSLFLIANKSISLQESTLTAVSLGIIAYDSISLNLSDLNATAQSCRTNTGLGRGAIIQYNNTNCTSGSSSCGFGLMSNSALCSDVVQYFLFLSHSFPYISKGPYLSTGSGGYGYNYKQNGRGAGGGIIFLYSKNDIIISSSLI